LGESDSERLSKNNRFRIDFSDNHVCLKFPVPRQTLSSAVFNGGAGLVENVLFMRVMENFDGRHDAFDDPPVTMDRYCQQIGLYGTTVGMMTSADMTSFRNVTRSEEGISVSSCLTAGLSNARCAGDRADIRDQEEPGKPGTINIALVTNVGMSVATMAEAIMMATEAKVAALRRLNRTSPLSGNPITGTGTDAVTIVSGYGPQQARYCGKHTLLGELIASAVIQSLHESLLGS